MSFLVYQRADPRFPEWHALQTQQMRLRNLIQVIGINLDAGKNANLFYTLHMSTSDTFFYSSEIHSTGAVVSWKKIDPGAIPSEIRLSADGFVIRIWSSCDGDKPITSWGVHLKSLGYIGTKGDWSSQDFLPYSLVFRMPYGYFTARSCMQTNIHDNSWIPFGLLKSPEAVRSSYTLANLALLHDVQRSVLEEVTVSRRLRLRINNSGYSCYMGPATTTKSLAPLSRNAHGDNFSVVKIEQQSQNSLRYQQGAVKIKLKQDIEILRLVVTLLRNEKARFEGRVLRLKQKAKSCDESDLMSRIHSLGRERDRLANVKSCIHKKMLKLAEQRSALYLRRKQLISELSVIYPLQLVEGSKRYSIAEVQLPNAEDYGSETGGQVSVALGYTAHLVAMLCFFLGIPLRYPVLHFGSRSRIVDHITMQIPNKEREFPLYFRGREDVYSKYAVYLLNKNVAQLRWYCGLSTSDLRATLPNVYNVLTSRLTIPGWPPIPCDNCEIAEELTEETHHQMFRGDLSLSLDGGLDQLSSTTNSFDEARMQSWFAASHSDLDGAGNNWVPAGELNHGRGQTRFLSGWKKKTYSDSEEIDPVWLTNSLNLELDFGGRGVTSTPSPPLRLPHISISEAKADEFVRRKRRHGRVETQNPSCDYTASLRTPDSRIHPTPNLSMDDVEKRIIANERRKSVCDPARIRSAMNLIKAHENFPLQQNEICDSTVPLVDNYLTTDDEKTDSIIADVVRRMSVVDFQNFKTDRPVSSSGPLVEDLSQDAETLSPLGSSRPSTPGIQHIDRPEQDDGQLNQVIINDEKIDRDSSLVGSSYKLDNTTGIPTSSLQTQTASHSETSDVQCKDNLDAKERNVNLCEYSLDSRNNFSNEEGTCGQNSVIASVESTTADEKGEGCRVQDTLNPDSDVVSSINGTINQDSPSIWHRTEALVNATSFNRLKRRMSEST